MIATRQILNIKILNKSETEVGSENSGSLCLL